MNATMLARTTDPLTSKDAAAHAVTLAKPLQQKIAETLRATGPGTFYEIAARADLKESSVWRRLNELEKLGAIVPTGEVKRGPTGRNCRVWRAAD